MTCFKPVPGPCLLPLILLVAGCAPFPASIEPEVSRGNRFAGQSCPALLDARARASANLDVLSKAQREAATLDAVTVALVGIPFSGGGHTQEVAQTKGVLHDLEEAIEIGDCR